MYESAATLVIYLASHYDEAAGHRARTEAAGCTHENVWHESGTRVMLLGCPVCTPELFEAPQAA